MVYFVLAISYLESYFSFLSIALKDIVLLLSEHLTYSIIWASDIYRGPITSLSLCPMKYLIGLFVPYGSFFETNILLNRFLFL